MHFSFLFYLLSAILLADETFYTIVLCNTKTEQKALECLTTFQQSTDLNVSIQPHSSGNFKTTLGRYTSIEEAKKFRYKILNQIDRKLDLSIETVTISNQTIHKNIVETPKTNEKSIPINSKISCTNTMDKQIINRQENNNSNQIQNEPKANLNAKKKEPVKSKSSEETLGIHFSNMQNFDNLLIEVNSSNHQLILYGIKNRDRFFLKNYLVSTARKNITKPLGAGGISSISLNPTWYPTKKTIDYFKEKKRILLPAEVEYGNLNNYMGAAKINLTHRVNGQNVYRIHGTINEATIGTDESSGCIRMKNKEVKELASALKKFIAFKSLDKIDVILK